MKKVEELISVKTEAVMMDEAVESLKSQNSKITNFNVGGIFRSLLALFYRPLYELNTLLAKTVMPQAFLLSAKGDWLDIKAAELGVTRKPATNTTGKVVFSRAAPEASVVPIPMGTMVKTAPDVNGKELVFITSAAATLGANQTEIEVPVIAEFEGSVYNVGAGSINAVITYVSGVDAVTNRNGWLTKEGTDEEADEPFRQRALLKWEQLSGFTSNYYVSLALEVNGVANAIIDDEQPRGQGTVDIIVSSVGGIPTAQLIAEVQEYIDGKKHLCDDVLVKAPLIVSVNIDVTVYAHPTQGDLVTIQAEAESIIDLMFTSSSDRPEIVRVVGTTSVNRAAFIANMMGIDNVVNAVLIAPAADTPLNVGEIPVKGTVNVTVERSV